MTCMECMRRFERLKHTLTERYLKKWKNGVMVNGHCDRCTHSGNDQRQDTKS